MLEYHLDSLPGCYNCAPVVDGFAQSFPFRCMDSGRFINGDAYYTRRDRFDSYLLIATVDGCGKMCWKGQSCLLENGSAVLIDCNIYQEYFTLPGHKWDFFYLHFRALSMEGYKNALLSKLIFLKLRNPEYVWHLIEQVNQMSRRPDVLSYAAQSNVISNLLTELLYSLVDDHTAAPKLYRPEITALAEYIDSHYKDPLSLEDFSNYTHLSKHYLIRVFARQMGMSPYRYLHMCRISHAQSLLKSSDMTVSQIAYAVGYNDPIVFTRHFKAFHMVTPAEYRKEFILLPTDDSDVVPRKPRSTSPA